MSYSSRHHGSGSSCCAPRNNKGGGARKRFGPHSPEDAELAREMNDLTVQEREKVFDDIHGVAQAHEETPEFTNFCTQQLDEEISDLSRTRRKELDRAFFLRPSFRMDIKFKLMFLRADNYDAKKAASRMANFFVYKQYLFGEDKLGKTITLDDLDEKDMKIFGEGAVLQLIRKDQIGRPIAFLDWGKFDWENPLNVVRQKLT
jgi:hypothetical protein